MPGGLEQDLDEQPATSGQGGVIFVLENANLETAKVGKAVTHLKLNVLRHLFVVT